MERAYNAPCRHQHKARTNAVKIQIIGTKKNIKVLYEKSDVTIDVSQGTSLPDVLSKNGSLAGFSELMGRRKRS